jgi:hypothetical protein
MIKSSEEIKERNITQYNEGCFDKHIANIVLQREMKPFPLKLGMSQVFPLFLLLI